MFWKKKKDESWRKNPYTKGEFQKDLEECVTICEYELAERKNGVEGIGTVGQIEAILKELYLWLNALKNGEDLSEMKRRGFWAAGFVLEFGWNINLGTNMTSKIGALSTNFHNLED